MITNENMILVSQEAKVKDDRYLTLNMNVDYNSIDNFVQGSNSSVSY